MHIRAGDNIDFAPPSSVRDCIRAPRMVLHNAELPTAATTAASTNRRNKCHLPCRPPQPTPQPLSTITFKKHAGQMPTAASIATHRQCKRVRDDYGGDNDDDGARNATAATSSACRRRPRCSSMPTSRRRLRPRQRVYIQYVDWRYLAKTDDGVRCTATSRPL